MKTFDEIYKLNEEIDKDEMYRIQKEASNTLLLT